MNNNFAFKNNFSFESRFCEAERIMNKYPDRIPIICEKHFNERSIPSINKTKYLVPRDLNLGQFIYVIRSRIKVPPEMALYVYINGIIPSTSSSINFLYETQRDLDNFLYVTYSTENTFG